jgi:hypothetical protein
VNYSFVGGILLICLGIVLLTNPWQFFSRHDPIMIKLSSSKSYRAFVKIIGCILVAFGILLEGIVLIRFLI